MKWFFRKRWIVRLFWVVVCVGFLAKPVGAGAAEEIPPLAFTDKADERFTWMVVLPNTGGYKTHPVSAEHVDSLWAEIGTRLEATLSQEAQFPDETILQAATLLYVAISRSRVKPPQLPDSEAGVFPYYEAVYEAAMQLSVAMYPSQVLPNVAAGIALYHQEHHAQMLAFSLTPESRVKRLIGSMAMGFLGELGRYPHASHVLFEEGLKHKNVLIVVKSAIAILTGKSPGAVQRLMELWSSLPVVVQDRVFFSVTEQEQLKAMVEVDTYRLLLETYLRTADVARGNHPALVAGVRGQLDLPSFKEMLVNRPEWMARLKNNRWEAIRELHQQRPHWFPEVDDPDFTPKISDSEILTPEINLVSAAMHVFLHYPPNKRDDAFYQVARRIVMNEVDRVAYVPGGWIRLVQALEFQITLIRRSDYIGTYEHFLEDPDLDMCARAAAAIIMKNMEFDGLRGPEALHSRALEVLQALIATDFLPAKLRRPMPYFHTLQRHIHTLSGCSGSGH